MLPEFFIKKFLKLVQLELNRVNQLGGETPGYMAAAPGCTINLTFSAMAALKGMPKFSSYSKYELIILHLNFTVIRN